jgi:hypothetical protein
MYGVPEDLDLTSFVGDEIVYVGIGQHQVSFGFLRAGNISVEGHWELRDAQGALIDEDREHASRGEWRSPVIMGVPVTAFTVDAPLSFSLEFADGRKLTVFDSSTRYESFSITPTGEKTIYV